MMKRVFVAALIAAAPLAAQQQNDTLYVATHRVHRTRVQASRVTVGFWRGRATD